MEGSECFGVRYFFLRARYHQTVPRFVMLSQRESSAALGTNL
jgi:hypothetical protein